MTKFFFLLGALFLFGCSTTVRLVPSDEQPGDIAIIKNLAMQNVARVNMRTGEVFYFEGFSDKDAIKELISQLVNLSNAHRQFKEDVYYFMPAQVKKAVEAQKKRDEAEFKKKESEQTKAEKPTISVVPLKK